MNANRGVIDTNDLKGLAIDPETSTDIVELSGAIGSTLSKRSRNSDQEDHPLWVYVSDFRRAKPDSINNGLYIPPEDPRYKTIGRLIVIGNETPNLKGDDDKPLKGMVPSRVGVVVGEGEYDIFARNAHFLARAAEARTLDANADNPDKKDAMGRAERSMAHVMETKLSDLTKFDADLLDMHAVLTRIYVNAHRAAQPIELPNNLNADRKLTDEFIHEIIEIISFSLNYGTMTTNALHRAYNSQVYRQGTTTQSAEQRMIYTNLAGRYINAKRGKVNQSQQACLTVFERHKPALEAAKEAAEIAEAA